MGDPDTHVGLKSLSQRWDNAMCRLGLRAPRQKACGGFEFQEAADELGVRIKRATTARETVENRDLRYRQFDDFNGAESTFKSCNFSFSIFSRAYFHNAKFENCSFIGCRFSECNFRGAEIYSCDFKYARFQNCLIESRDIIPSLPPEPNLRRELLQNLRVNAIQLGSTDEVRAYTLEEISAELEHYKRALFGYDRYYQRKYPTSLDKIIVLIKLISHAISGFFWGHGERPFKLLLSVIILLILASFVNWFSYEPDSSLGDIFYGGSIFLQTLNVFLGIGDAFDQAGYKLVNYAIVLMRYVYIGLLVTVAMRSITYR
ncbi:hypothetical protein GRI62_03705 [Erythrobacter arachoides]|uniref:Pentapeptide repeat-containing protein n=1 Tax=Aurantiacibacter arachoides TaxID=1850444 RepID=A0A844ZZR0_9SPHN|nr:pentapeptide repeat-containing protein [Aurantiacibacter arachoides]MXO92712.1 hypothetical protein [Aurantiacibacter arachoides]